MKQASKQALNELGEAWGHLPPDADSEERFRLSGEIFRMAYELFEKKSEAIGELFLRDFPRFDPQKGDLYDFMNSRLELRLIDIMHMDQGDRRVTEHSAPADDEGGRLLQQGGDEGDDDSSGGAPLPNQEAARKSVKRQKWVYAASLDEPADEGGGSTLMDRCLPGRESDDPTAGIRYDEKVIELLTLVLQLPQRLGGRANNPRKLNYFRMFFTDSVVDILQRGLDHAPFSAHERELFRTLQLGFMDYFLKNVCRTVQAITVCPDKPYGELVPGRPMTDEPGHPLPNDVYMVYLNTLESYSIRSPGTISNQRREYERFLREGGIC